MNNIKSKYSEYILENPEFFNLKHIFECGQSFRWNYDEKNARYIGIAFNNVISVKEVFENDNKKPIKKEVINIDLNNNINNNVNESKSENESESESVNKDTKYIFKSTFTTNKELEEFVIKYFNLNLEYKEIRKVLSENNSIDILGRCSLENRNILEHNLALKTAMEYGYGIRILKQDIWETIVSFIISANNNIPRIKKSIEKISERYGKKIVFEDKNYYTFPTPEELKDVTVEELRECGLGFRDKRIFDIVKVFFNNENIFDLNNDTNILKEQLMEYNGIGPKVADCILLFGFNRYETFPTDVWVRRVMNDIYFRRTDEKKLSDKEILTFAKEKYGKYSGIAQQYLFYWKREINE